MAEKEPESYFDETPDNQGTPEPEGSQGDPGKPQATQGDGSTPGNAAAKPPAEPLDFGGLPFKDISELVKAHKELQSRATRRDQEFYAVLEAQKRLFAQQQAAGKPEPKPEDPEEFVRNFVTNPRGVLDSLIKSAIEAGIKEHIEPIRGEVTGLRSNTELQGFLGAHPELEDADADLIMKAMDAYPEVGTRKDRLEIWLRLAQEDNPQIRERIAAKKASLEKPGNDAKKAASQGGHKSMTPRTGEEDPFDEVMNLYNSKYKYYQDRRASQKG